MKMVDRALIWVAVRVYAWSGRTIARIRGKRGRDFVRRQRSGELADRIDRVNADARWRVN